MIRLPPHWVRRLLIAPGVVLLAIMLLVTVPAIFLVVLTLAAFVPGRFRAPRVIWLVIYYVIWDAVWLVCLFVLWVASGFGWKIRAPGFQRAHYALAGLSLRTLFRHARWVLRLEIRLTGDTPDPESFGQPLAPGRPVIVACRHAGPGDSLILVHTLINAADREPRIVLKDTLQWDPAIDVMLNRLPSRFIAPRPFDRESTGRGMAAEIGALARGLDENDAFVIFPEGGNFTPRRRDHRIARLRQSGEDDLAERAERMRHVLAPYTGGLFAAVDAAPEADVVFIGHTGLDRLTTAREIWRELPMDKVIVMRGWHVGHDGVPTGREPRQDWLYTWFETIDRWVEENQVPGRRADGGSGPGQAGRADR